MFPQSFYTNSQTYTNHTESNDNQQRFNQGKKSQIQSDVTQDIKPQMPKSHTKKRKTIA